jgi:anaerobic carbon-monoxide dehydrogenase iron sulfur subunit
MNDNKVLAFDVSKCTGCRACEVRCSFKHFRVINPARSRIRVMKLEEVGVNIAIACHQCEDAPCITACPTRAIYKDRNTDARVIDELRCIGCRTCADVCPFGAIAMTPDKRLIKCTLCEGDPECVKHCETGALSYIKVEKAEVEKRYQFARKLLESMK